MKKSLIRLLILFTASGSLLLSSSTALAAFNPFNQACSGGGPTSATCQDSSAENATQDSNGNFKNPIYHEINVTANILGVIGGIAGVITIMVGGLGYITSGGDSSKVAAAKTKIIGAIVGMAILALAWTIVSFGVKLLKS